MKDDTQSYWAFISYNHADEKWATWLHRSLERYRIPGSLGADTDVPKRLFPVFRDRDELPSAPGLPEKIQHALDASRALIVICSPYGAASKWVAKEVAYFKASGRADRVFCLIVDGEPNASDDPDIDAPEAFPEAVRFDVDAEENITSVRAEPLAADVRHGRDGKQLALLKLVAGILDVGLDTLRMRDKRRKVRVRIAATAAAALVAGVFAAVVMNQQRETAIEKARATAGQLLNQAAELSADEVESKLLLTAAASRIAREGTDTVMPEAEVALYRALESSRLMGEVPQDRRDSGGWVWAPVMDPTGQRVVFPGPEPTLMYDVHLHEAVALTEAGSTLSATFLDDGTLITTGRDGAARFWNATGELVGTRQLHSGNLLSVVFNPTRDIAVSVGCLEGGFDCRLVARIWDSAWRQLGEIAQPGESVTSAVWAPDGASFFTADTAGLVQRWNTDGSRIGRFTNPRVWLGAGAVGRERILTGHPTPWRYGGMFDPLRYIERTARPARFSDSSSILNLNGGVMVPLTTGSDGTFSPNGEYLLTIQGAIITVRSWQGRVLSSIDVGERVEDVDFTEDGSLIAVATEYSLSMYTTWGELIERVERDARSFGPFVRFGPDDATVAAAACPDAHQGACLAHTVQVWDLAGSLERVVQLFVRKNRQSDGALSVPPLVRFSPDGELILAVVNGGTRAFVVDSGAGVMTSMELTGTVLDAEFDAEADVVRLVLTGLIESNPAALATATWRWQDERELSAIRGLDADITGADWDTTGRLAVVDTSLGIQVFDTASNRISSTEIDEEELVPLRSTDWVPRYAIQFNDSGQALVAASVSDARVDVRQDSNYSGDIVGTISLTGDVLRSWAVDPLGTPLVIGDRLLAVECTDRFRGATIGRGTTCRDSAAHVYDLQGNRVATLDRPLDEDTNFVFGAADADTASGRFVTVGDDVRLWNAQGNLLASYPGAAAAFQPDGRAIAILHENGRLDIRQIQTDIVAMENAALARSVSRVSREQCVALVGKDYCENHKGSTGSGE